LPFFAVDVFAMIEQGDLDVRRNEFIAIAATSFAPSLRHKLKQRKRHGSVGANFGRGKSSRIATGVVPTGMNKLCTASSPTGFSLFCGSIRAPQQRKG
jgi:hypothetical protein